MTRLLLFYFLLLIFIPKSSQASHLTGGEVSWECLPNGSYVFYAKIYRDCNGIPHQFTNTTLEILGNPLPRDQSNMSISSIILRPDSNAFSNNGGDITPIVDSTTCSTVGLSISCANGDVGSIQEFSYRSDPVQFFGQIPNAGWIISLTVPCCRPFGNSNTIGGGQMVLQSTMYPDTANQLNQNLSGQCIDNSPRFIESPEYLFCFGQEANINFGAIDLDGDSLVYSWDRTFNVPAVAPQALLYQSGFNFNNPTPDQSFDSLNVPANLNRSTGIANFYINSNPMVGPRKYMLSVRVSAYRNGNLISQQRREYPSIILDCSPNVRSNNNPRINPPFYNGASFVYKDSVQAGSPVNINLSVIDTNRVNNTNQNVRIELSGQSMANDLRTVTNCPLPNDTACAITISVPSYDSTRGVYYYTASRNWSSILSWTTDCSDLTANGSAKTHYFYIKAQDGMCPIPGRTIKAIEITVLPDPNNCQGSITNLKEVSYEDQLQLFPNPSNGKIWLSRSLAGETIVQIYDFSGKLMKESSLGPNQVEFELPEPNGIYFVRIRMSDGRLESFKMIKQ